MNEVIPNEEEGPFTKSWSWEVELKDSERGAEFRLAVVADFYDEACEAAVWAAATEKQRPLSNYTVIGVVRQRRITY